VRLGIFGRGRLSTALAVELESGEGERIEVVWRLGRGESPPAPVDLALDASSPLAVAEHLAWAMATGTDLVIAATGWEASILGAARAEGAGLPIGILVAPNLSLGVAFLKRAALALGRLAALDPGADLAVSERHHRAKKDAPSGTARLLASALAEGCPRYATEVLPVVSLRLGLEAGFHELRLESAHETLTLSHEARDRALFARGTRLALPWIRGRKGVYSFDDFAAQIIDPLFAPPGRRHPNGGSNARC